MGQKWLRTTGLTELTRCLNFW